MFALLDANNFYASCEIAFNPRLAGKVLYILSNNDGCAIARSEEAKALGIKMGEPDFRIRARFPNEKLIAMSANFTHYGEMSARLMGEAAAFGCAQEIYSVDECFIDLSGIPGNLTRRGHVIRNRILKRLGLPCGIGMGETKTQAKLANHIAKSAVRKPGSYPAELGYVCNLSALPASDLDALMQATPAGEIWGVGRRIAEQFESLGIRTALDVARLDPAMVRKRWSVVLDRAVRELQDQSCIALEDVREPKKEIASTRSFGGKLTTIEPMRQAVTDYATRAAEKLRLQNSKTSQVQVFCHTSPHRTKDPQYYGATTVPLLRPSSSTLDIVNAALRGLEVIYKPGYKFIKAGVMLLELVDASAIQHELDFDDPNPRNEKLMAAFDAINDRYGRGTLRLGSAGMQNDNRHWEMKQLTKSPQYTTNWR